MRAGISRYWALVEAIDRAPDRGETFFLNAHKLALRNINANPAGDEERKWFLIALAEYLALVIDSGRPCTLEGLGA